MSKLSAREKILIISLLFTALVVGGFFLVIKPVIDERAQNKLVLADVQAEKQTLLAQLDMLSTIEKTLEDTRTKVQEKEPKFYSGNIYTWEIDRYLVALMEKQNLKVTSLQVVGPSQYSISNVSKDENGNVKEDSSTPTDAKIATTTLTFEGNVEQVINFVDSIERLDRQITIRAWSYQVDKENLKGNLIMEMYCK